MGKVVKDYIKEKNVIFGKLYGSKRFEQLNCVTHGLVSVKSYNEDLTECTTECGCKFHWNDTDCIWEAS